MAGNKYFSESCDAEEEWKRLDEKDGDTGVIWGQVVPHPLFPPPPRVFQDQAKFTHVVEFAMEEEDTDEEEDDGDLEKYSCNVRRVLSARTMCSNRHTSTRSFAVVICYFAAMTTIFSFDIVTRSFAAVAPSPSAYVGLYVCIVLLNAITFNCNGCEVDHPSQRQHCFLMDHPQDQFYMFINETMENLCLSDVLMRQWLVKVSMIDALRLRYSCEDSAVAEIIEFSFDTLNKKEGIKELKNVI
ncbi:uncharacterized protein [Asterias amurensis]|uniref:uncharacterized protein n=1 Tax=Asterias amurensis TaxID=7602 RepID=UPI003AB70BE1